MREEEEEREIGPVEGSRCPFTVDHAREFRFDNIINWTLYFLPFPSFYGLLQLEHQQRLGKK